MFSPKEGEHGETDLVHMSIVTDNASPAQGRILFAVRQEVAKQLKAMQCSRMITPYHSPWLSPVIMVKKKDGSHRLCVD